MEHCKGAYLMCKNCKYFNPINKDKHPNHFEDEGVCEHPHQKGDLVDENFSCEYYKS